MASGVCMEGFICPHCMDNLGNLSCLQEHFENVHSQKRSFSVLFKERESASAFMKGIFSRVKYQKDDTLEISVEETLSPLHSNLFDDSTKLYHYFGDDQEIGHHRLLMDTFKFTRDRHVDQLATKTNQLLIRLGKITSLITSTDATTSDKKTKQKEMEIVNWKDRKNCGNCAKKFIVGGKHHCRLCGELICSNCSCFLPMPYAVLLYKASKKCLDPEACQKALKIAKREVAESVREDKLSNSIRNCLNCSELMEKRLYKLNSMHSRPKLCMFYEHLRDNMRQVDYKLPKYSLIIASLMEGKYDYSVTEAQELRFALLQLFEIVDQASKKIVALLDNNEDPSQRQTKLYKGIRNFAVNYLQQCITNLPNAPCEKELSEIRKKKIQERNKLKLEASKSFPKKDKNSEQSSNLKQRSNSYLVGTGWLADSNTYNAPIDYEDNPFLIQKNQLTSFLAHAEKEGRHDEVESLKDAIKAIDCELLSQSQS